MNIPSTVMKSTLLAFCIFWLIIMSQSLDSGLFPFIVISVIPISICCLLVILFTIYPFFWQKKEKDTNATIYKKYFPFYAIVCWSLCVYPIIECDFDIPVISFFSATFFTALQSWNWLAKENIKKPLNKTL